MENETFNITDIKKLRIKQEDFDIALENFKTENVSKDKPKKHIVFFYHKRKIKKGIYNFIFFDNI